MLDLGLNLGLNLGKEVFRRAMIVWLLLCCAGGTFVWAAPVQAHKVRTSILHIQNQLNHINQQHQLTLQQQHQVQEQQIAAEQKIGQLLRGIEHLRALTDQLNLQLIQLKKRRVLLHHRLDGLRQALLQEDVLIWKASRHDYFQMILNAQQPAQVPVLLHNFRIIAQLHARHMQQLQQDVAELQQNEQQEQQQLLQFKNSQQALLEHKKALEQARTERLQALKVLKGQSQSEEAKIARFKRHETELSALLQRLLTHPVQHVLPKKSAKSPEGAHRGTQKRRHGRPVGEVAGGSETVSPTYAPQTQCPLPVPGNLKNHFAAPRLGGMNWNGVVIATTPGTAVRSVGAGTVVYAGYVRGFGWLVIVQHSNGLMLLYGQNRSLLTKMGESVSSGQVIAQSGDTGDASVPGVYFEVRHLGHPVDPLGWCHD